MSPAESDANGTDKTRGGHVARSAMIVTLGCRLNQADEALLASRLTAAGYRMVAQRGAVSPDLMVVNTCTVTATAAQKSRQAVRALRRRHPGAVLVAAGCGPQAEPERWAAEADIDLVVDNLAKAELPALVAKFAGHQGAAVISGVTLLAASGGETIFRENALARFPRRTRALLKIQEGCNGRCAYCLVPQARGPERSRDRAEVLAEFARLLACGHREIVLTGINICAWRQRGRGIADLVADLLATPGEYRLRLGSLEPHPAVPELIDLIAQHPGRICRFLHLSLQHGDDEMLERMNRPYRRADFTALIKAAAVRIPGIHLGTDVIIGFPGESDGHFRRSREAIAALPLANLHLFRFSPRPGTSAANLPERVPTGVAQRRRRELADVATALAAGFRAGQCGQVLTMLTERRCGGGLVEGWTDNYLRVRVAAPEAPLNALLRVRLGDDAASPAIILSPPA